MEDKEAIEFEERLARRWRAREAWEDGGRLGAPWMDGPRRHADDECND